jgi:hypothetical protein
MKISRPKVFIKLEKPFSELHFKGFIKQRKKMVSLNKNTQNTKIKFPKKLKIALRFPLFPHVSTSVFF